ncbi:EamA family transporter [Nocardia jinanensis]|uniref:Threonine transporter RhtB n=1 Tax=Nocardia jinanensis TaxID=382504 RepID=A0A917RS05_9NOCA|nr:EamA family transporter [Nocardia jinanensis]GGL21061.1 threonine transporter RhtB [Nocardia jinanensis]
MICIHLGSATAKNLIEIAGAQTTVCLRIALAGLLAMLIWRPSLRIDPRAVPGIVALGAAIAGMNLCFYAAIEHIPLGMAVTIEFLGPLCVALLTSWRPSNLILAATAGVGVLLLTDSAGTASWTGIGFALLSGLGWAGYIVFGKAVARHTATNDALALALGLGTLVTVPVLLTRAEDLPLDPWFLIGAVAVAVLTSLVPHAIELNALRRMEVSTFGVMMSMGPAVAALAGLLLLGETLRPVQWLGIAAVVGASAGATLLADRHTPAAPETPGEHQPIRPTPSEAVPVP